MSRTENGLNKIVGTSEMNLGRVELCKVFGSFALREAHANYKFIRELGFLLRDEDYQDPSCNGHFNPDMWSFQRAVNEGYTRALDTMHVI